MPAIDPIALLDNGHVADAAWGAAGGVVKALTLRERLGSLIVSLVVGAITASKFGPVFDPIMDGLVQNTLGSVLKWLWSDAITVPQITPAHLGPFTVGILALSLVAFMIDFTRGLIKRFSSPTPPTRSSRP